MALLICVAVAPGFNVAQMVVRFEMPPVTPAVLQSVARAGARIPLQGVEAAKEAAPQKYITALTTSTNNDRRTILVITLLFPSKHAAGDGFHRIRLVWKTIRSTLRHEKRIVRPIPVRAPGHRHTAGPSSRR